ncbi:MAG TPA: hypothetical protein DDW54_00675 [Clostridiales bacterium]|nr:hypothetical protein [Clostridiales bacterium]
MFVTLNQFYYFSECVFIGLACGIFYEFFAIFSIAFKNGVVRAVADISYLLVLFFFYYGLSLKFRFPSVRLYMPAGVILGFSLYFVTLHKILAKFIEKGYNIGAKTLRRIADVGRKKAKSRKRGDGDKRDSGVSSDNYFRVSVDLSRSKEKRRKRTKKTDNRTRSSNRAK